MREVLHAKTLWWFWTVTPRSSACTRHDCNTNTSTVILMNLIISRITKAKLQALSVLPYCPSQAFQHMVLRLNHGAFSAWTVSQDVLPGLSIQTRRMVPTVSTVTEFMRRVGGAYGGLTISSASIYRARRRSTPDLGLRRLLIFHQECDLLHHFRPINCQETVQCTVTCPLRPAPVVNQIGARSWPILPVPLTVQYLISRIFDRH